MEMLGKGRQGEVYALSDTECLKLFYADASPRDIEREAGAMRYIGRLPISSPRFLGYMDRDGRRGIRMERVRGVTMLAAVLRDPSKLVPFGEEMGRMQREYNALPGDGLPSMRESLAWSIGAAGLLTQAEKDALLAALTALPDGDRLLHTDYHMDNIMVAEDGMQIIDWIGMMAGNPMADAARTYLSCLPGTYPIDASPELCRKLDEYREILKEAYLRGYGISESALADWVPIIAASRLRFAPAEEREATLALIRPR